ncbi:hypothetical protein [Elizabethkingia anophelis]|uniref:hypothetical protein n=2 Tax=Elizabethkingia TaxID=308865 RepID=UPI00389281D6
MAGYSRGYFPQRKQYYGEGSYAPFTSRYNEVRNQQQRGFKRSGASYTKIKKGKNVGQWAINAFRRTRNGFMTASAMPVDGVVHTSERGNEFMRYVVNVVDHSTGQISTFWTLMTVKTQVLVIKELGLCISPNGSGTTRKGRKVRGYFGRFTKN